MNMKIYTVKIIQNIAYTYEAIKAKNENDAKKLALELFENDDTPLGDVIDNEMQVTLNK